MIEEDNKVVAVELTPVEVDARKLVVVDARDIIELDVILEDRWIKVDEGI